MFTLDFRIGLHHLPHQPKHIQVEDVDTIEGMYCKEREESEITIMLSFGRTINFTFGVY